MKEQTKVAIEHKKYVIEEKGGHLMMQRKNIGELRTGLHERLLIYTEQPGCC